MPAITISREIGSLGDAIAEQTARRLGYALVDKNVIGKVFGQFGFVDFKEVYDDSGFWSRFDPHYTEMAHLLNQMIEILVLHGNIVLLGRGGFAVLKGYADVLNVRIQAPFSIRVARVMEEYGLASQADAEEFVKVNDRMRRSFVESIYGHQWDAVSAFDLVLDTGKISPELAVHWLEAEIAEMGQGLHPEKRTTRDIQVDPVLARTVEEIIAPQAA